ncbi:MAG: hypothetical protein HYW79_02215 [Parcubacteria group bacterium]|nr:hypothetical protein [Parcubacteria group bacterium]
METMKFDEVGPESEQVRYEASQGEENNQAAPKAPRNKRLIWGGVILAVLILAVIGWQYWRYTQSPYYQQMKAIKTIEKDLKEQDKWGGKTPEETVRLFTEAVKKGDFELASKYGRSEDIKPVLEKIKNDGNIGLLIEDLENGMLEESPGFAGEYVDLIIKESGKTKYSVLTMHKSDGGTWKIVEF